MGEGVFTLTLHPQVIGRGHRLLMLEKLIDNFASHDDVVFSTMGAFVRQWREENPLTI